MNKMENNDTIKKMNKAKSRFFEKSNENLIVIKHIRRKKKKQLNLHH